MSFHNETVPHLTPIPIVTPQQMKVCSSTLPVSSLTSPASSSSAPPVSSSSPPLSSSSSSSPVSSSASPSTTSLLPPLPGTFRHSTLVHLLPCEGKRGPAVFFL
ncbi:hypothetical protein E2C01_041604 [Portunus trituberculatus]|uniref:Uncharacterized protein n=1 Tax=Portunus trituberculatus TaxID=210409 RepID=A0A5B7FR34_PORTR|nr:hypothetical protein [Portunus trituberculatus]